MSDLYVVGRLRTTILIQEETIRMLEENIERLQAKVEQLERVIKDIQNDGCDYCLPILEAALKGDT